MVNVTIYGIHGSYGIYIIIYNYIMLDILTIYIYMYRYSMCLHTVEFQTEPFGTPRFDRRCHESHQ